MSDFTPEQLRQAISDLMSIDDLDAALHEVISWVAAAAGHEPSHIMLDGEDRAAATVVIHHLNIWRARYRTLKYPDLETLIDQATERYKRGEPV